MKDHDYPALYEAANAASMTAQKHFFHALFWNLTALVIAAALSVWNQPDVSFAYAQIVMLVISLGCTVYVGAQQPQKIWYGTRAVAESVKTITWRYMVRAEPYDADDTSATQRFADDLHAILEENKEISKHALHTGGNTQQITAFMNSKRMLPLYDRKAFYIADRITEQLQWYGRKARFNKGRSTLYFVILVLVNLGAIGFAIARVANLTQPYWPTDIFIAAAGSIMAWVQAKRFQELSASYTLTAHEIGIMQTKLPNTNDEKDFSLFIGDAENAFSREHTQWLARRDQ
jgi:hypothetical protein